MQEAGLVGTLEGFSSDCVCFLPWIPESGAVEGLAQTAWNRPLVNRIDETDRGVTGDGKKSASCSGAQQAGRAGGGGNLPEGCFRKPDVGRLKAGKGGESPGGSPAGRLGPVPPTTCLSTCSQGGGSMCWGKGEEAARALPCVGVLHPS